MKVQVERVLYDSPDTGFNICKAAVLEATQEDNIPMGDDTLTCLPTN